MISLEEHIPLGGGMEHYSDGLIMAGLSRYLLIYEIDLEKDLITCIYKGDEQGTFGMKEEMKYSEFLNSYIPERVDTEYQDQQMTYGSPDFLRDNLAPGKVLSTSYTNKYGKWRQTEWFPCEFAGGVPVKVFFAFRKVEDDRASTYRLRQEAERERGLLEMALREANAANQAKALFLKNMSHDFRTPMNTVMGYTQLALTQAQPGSELESYLRGIMSASNELVRMMDNMLDITRIRSGREHIVENEESLKSIVGELRAEFTPMCKERKQKFRVKMETPDRILLCDRARMLQIMMVILTNASIYSDEKTEITLTVQEQRTPLSSYVTLEFMVEDHGIGIDKEFARKIFQPFSREYGSSENGIPGSGLGLALAKELVEMMGGKIFFTSEKGVGSVFHVVVDFHLSDQDPIRRKTENEKSLRQQENALHGMFEGRRFLIVDDQMECLEEMSRILHKYGANVEAAANGIMGAEMVKRSNPFYYNAVLMDVKMTGLDGFGAARRIRNLGDPDLAGVPIIAVGVDAYSVDREKLHSVGIDAYITKPVKESELVRKLQDVSL